MGWFEEKETLTKTIRMLKDKVSGIKGFRRLDAFVNVVY